MKVLLDLQYLNVATTGIKTYMMELAKAARKYPHKEIEWIFTHEPDEQVKDQSFKGPQTKIQRLNYHLDYLRWKEFQLPDLVKKHQPDVLICPDFVSPAASLPCRRLTVIHDAFFWQMPQNYPRWWRKYFLSLIKKGLREKTEIITTTEYSRISIEKHLGKNWPISVIYQTPKSLKAASDQSIIKKLLLTKSSYFLHIGTFDKRKQLPLLVKAFADFVRLTVSDKKMVLVGGPGQSAQMNDLPLVERLIEELGMKEKILLPGYLTDGEIKALYENAFAYVFPSENEGFGIPIPEAMGFGLPVIHSDQEALLEVAGGAGLSFQTGNQEDLLEKMIHLDQEKELCESMKAKGKIRSQEFSAQKFIEAFQRKILEPSLVE
ncbi:MAG TPA: glycosyltransferase family 1 protein [Algoriphagus sp.]|uniref:glycosyltransferase family 4 protein n=1 Tax=unclassified Algoriphagus TaxID=2641541 RepID=UPI000C42546F|nr:MULTISPECIES: glycosyltransferase family 1 protein [unclassified Algoriphagus]MAL15955.1 glycosyl transferase [Algoriphagus sp.]MAN89019.1 glycosyl transferase [Algoriphagus sp.]HAD52353.1 glycosyltransferase family 1 protein [Algoriphagus sp.]HAH38195.1 glycosyltransferase family 1 protein [Algoriphagus sp.]HAS59918.1 glycosyltransferase family 1 protein [Algoriphagus sp.]